MNYTKKIYEIQNCNYINPEIKNANENLKKCINSNNTDYSDEILTNYNLKNLCKVGYRDNCPANFKTSDDNTCIHENISPNKNTILRMQTSNKIDIYFTNSYDYLNFIEYIKTEKSIEIVSITSIDNSYSVNNLYEIKTIIGKTVTFIGYDINIKLMLTKKPAVTIVPKDEEQNLYVYGKFEFQEVL